MRDGRRVVVTGRGVITSTGEGPEGFWSALLEGRSGVRRITRSDASRYRNQLACEVPLDDPLVPDRPELGRGSALLLRVARAAAREAGLVPDGRRAGVVVGSALLDLRQAEDILCEGKPSPHFVANFSMGATVARELGLHGYNVTFPNACGSGTLAVGVAADLIALGELDAVLAAGADTFTESMIGLADRANLRAAQCVAPFDRKRAGPLLGEGAAALMLESEASAKTRGSHVFGEVVSAGISCDARSTHALCEEGVSAAVADALARAGMAPDDIDYVCAHGTATDVNDLAEVRVLKRVLGARAHAIPVSAIKSMIGHTSGASGAIAVLASLLAIEHGVAPPTMNLTEPGEEFDLNFVALRPQRWPIEAALVNGFGFGGTNSCVVVRRYGG